MKLKNTTKILSLALLTAFLSSNVNAGELEDKYFSKDKVNLTNKERESIKIAEKWAKSKGQYIKPLEGENGELQFVYGAQYPTIVCAVLEICDISLEEGESINGIDIGDKVRWSVSPSVEGAGANQTIHLIVIPRDVGLETSIALTTNKRVYHMRLKSSRHEYMPKVSFIYPEKALAKWDAIKNQQAAQVERNTIPKTREYLGDLSFDYTVTGDAPWKPVRVFNDGRKTIIQMPKSMKQTEAPTFLVVRKSGGWFSNDKTIIVNYRVQGDRYIIDTIFKKGVLIIGVGDDQEKVTITKGGE